MSAPVRDKFIKNVLSEVRFSFAHAAIKEELNDHLDAHIESLMESGMDEHQAIEDALEAMGDPTIIGQELNDVHQPGLGWALMLTKAALVIVSCFIFIQIIWPYGYNFYETVKLQNKLQSELNPINQIHEKIVNVHPVNYKFKTDFVRVTIGNVYTLDTGQVVIEMENKLRNPFALFKQEKIFEDLVVRINHQPERVKLWGIQIANTTDNFFSGLSTLDYDVGPVASIQIDCMGEIIDVDLKEAVYE